MQPYSVFGDINGNYIGEPKKGGSYFIEATPYSQPRGKGIAGPTVTLQVYIYGAGNLTLASGSQSFSTSEFTRDKDAILRETDSFFSFPNSFSNQATISFTPGQSGFVTLNIYDEQGAFVKTLYEGEAEMFKNQSFNLSSEGLKDGIYILSFTAS